MFKKNLPQVPDILYPFVLKYVKAHFPTWRSDIARDLVHDAHCAAILMEGLINIPPEKAHEALHDAIVTARTIYEREVIELSKVSEEEFAQASICLARLACDVLLMRPPGKRTLFNRRKSGAHNAKG